MKYTCPKCDIDFQKNEGADPICPICGRDVTKIKTEALDSVPTEEVEINWAALDSLIPSIRELPHRLPKRLRSSSGPTPFQLRYGNIQSPSGSRHTAAALYVTDKTTTRLGLYIDGVLAIKTTWSKNSLPDTLDAALIEVGWSDLIEGERFNLTAREVFLADQDDAAFALR